MGKREIYDLDLKIKYTNEYLNNGGIEKIHDQGLLQDLINIKFDSSGKVMTETITPRVNAFMLVILASHYTPPVYTPNYQSEYISTLQKANFFYQDAGNIDTVDQFDKIYEEYKLKTDVLFRGQREAKWRLYSKIQRLWLLDKLYEKEENFISFLEQLTINGRETYLDKIKEILLSFDINSVNDVAILGYLQHHGCPTPLLDWTYKFQNALYFAFDGVTPSQTTKEIDDYVSVYFIEEHYFEGADLRTIIDKSLTSVNERELKRIIGIIAKSDEQRIEMEEHFKGRVLLNRVAVIESGLINYFTQIKNLSGFKVGYFSDKDVDSGIIFSLNNSKNILNQNGVFTWNSDPSKPLEMMGEEHYKSDKTDDAENNYRFCDCININKSLAPHIKQRLEKDGITKDYIYPTTDINTWEIFERSKKK